MPMKLNRNKRRKMRIARQSPEASKSKMHFKSYMFENFKKGCLGDQSCTMDDMEWTNQITECPVFHPSMEDFEDPFKYLHKIAPEVSKYGVCKIVPPLVSSVPTGVVMMKEKPGFKFTPKVQPLRVAGWTMSDKSTFFVSGKHYTLRDFEVMANRVTANKYFLSGCLPSAFLEKEFWLQMTCGKKGTVEYGVNIDGSAFSSSSNDQFGNSKWNLKKVPRLPKSALRLVEHSIPGVTDPMLYIGMLFSMFAWHVEDHYLYSINYHHCGAPKTWYGVPGSAAHEFEKIIKDHVYTREILSNDGVDGAFELLADKTTMFPPKILLQNHVPVYKVVQLPGEFVITFPRAYHAGFSHGFNCGEAVNFAARDWFPFGNEANKRYALLKKTPIVPYEEILCKEAMILSSKTLPKHNSNRDIDANSTTNTNTDTVTNPDADVASDRFIKVSFTTLIRKHNGAILWLKSLDGSLGISPILKDTISCSLCKRDCYVAHVTCSCRADPICVFHDKELSNCCCGRKRVLFVRGDLPEMEDIAKRFEEEERLIQEAEKHMKHNCISHGSNQYKKGWIKYATCSRKNVVDAATPVNRTTKRGKVVISSTRKKWTRYSRRLKELKNKYRNRASICHLCSKNAH